MTYKTKKYYDAAVKAGVCVSCGNKTDGSVRCDACSKRRQQARKYLRDSRALAGLCQDCGRVREREDIRRCNFCNDLANKRRRKRTDKNRKIVIDWYSNGMNCCVHCGIPHRNFLEIDHINGGGNQHRRELGLKGHRFSEWLVYHGFPPGYQVLCSNCNSYKGKFGELPTREVLLESYINAIKYLKSDSSRK